MGSELKQYVQNSIQELRDRLFEMKVNDINDVTEEEIIQQKLHLLNDIKEICIKRGRF